MADEANQKTPEEIAAEATAAAEAEAARVAAEQAAAVKKTVETATAAVKKGGRKAAEAVSADHGENGPVYALNKITYGKKQSAPANSIFWPASAKERAELIAMGAARELSESEENAAPPAPADDGPLG